MAGNIKTILIVEDEVLIAMSEKMTLKRNGFNVIIANTGEKAVDIINSTAGIDLILMDINLGGGMDGTEAAEIISRKNNIPIIFLSSYIESEIVQKTEGITSYGYIVKNSGETVLIASIKMAFRLYESRIKEQEKEEDLWIKNYAIINSINAIAFSDLSGNLTYVNKSILNLWKYENENEVLGKPVISFLENEIAAKEDFKQLLQKEYWSGEMRAKRKDGSIFYVKINANLLKSKDGKPICLMAAFTDITENIKIQEKLSKTNKLLEETFKQSPVPMVLVSMPDAIIEIVNPACRKFLGIEDEPSPVGTSLLNYIPSFRDLDVNGNIGNVKDLPLARSLRGEKTYNEEWQVIRKDGTSRWEMVSGVPICNDKGDIIAGYLIMVDITDLKKAEAEANNNNILLSMFIKNSPIYAYIKEVSETESRVLTASENYIDMIGIPGSKMTGKTMQELFSAEFAEKITADDWHVVANDKIIQIEEFLNDHYYITVKFPLKINVKKLLAGYTIDITEQKNIEKNLNFELNRINNILSSIPSGLFIYEYKEPDKLFLESGNQDAEKLTGIKIDDWIGKEFNEIWPNAKNKGITEKYLNVMRTGKNIEIEDVYYKDNSVDGAFRIRAFTIPENKLGVAFENITKIKKSDEEIKRQLLEKEMLLKEVHHRIKNNFIAIENILKIQLDSIANIDAIASIQETVSRIASMRILYEKLLITEDYQNISAEKYLNDLIDTLSSLLIGKKKIVIQRKIEDCILNSKQMFYIGIITNELVTNAVKYAFINKDEGVVKIFFIKSDNQLKLSVQDNGIGLPDGFNFNKSTGFGMMLIKILIEQLNGTYKIENNSGTNISIEFKL